MNKEKTGVNLENLAILLKVVEDGGHNCFVMYPERYYRGNNICAYCFGGRVLSFFYDNSQSAVSRTALWLNISEKDAVNLCCRVPNEYPDWTAEERFQWALVRLDELKKTGQVERLPLYYTGLRYGT